MRVKIEAVREHLNYDPQTGTFRWRIDRGRNCRAGTRAGWRAASSRPASVRIHGTVVYLRDCAWVLTHGEWPKRRLRCANGDANDLRIENIEMTDRRSYW